MLLTRNFIAMPDPITIRPATQADFRIVCELLQSEQLPTIDLRPDLQHFFLAIDKDQPIGLIGLDFYGINGLLRSMVVLPPYRNQGVAGRLIDTLEAQARDLGIRQLYLITNTAENYFRQKGFARIQPGVLPADLAMAPEFNGLCPASSAIMTRPVQADTQKKKFLFVCVENSNRSQMSQAFAKILGGDQVEAFSAGSRPSGIVNPKAIAAMKALGYDLSTHDSKSLDEVKAHAPFDAVITMGCGDACPWMPAKSFIDWQIPDPKHLEPQEFNQVRDFIREKVKELLLGQGLAVN
jgi:arsenate reductase